VKRPLADVDVDSGETTRSNKRRASGDGGSASGMKASSASGGHSNNKESLDPAAFRIGRGTKVAKYFDGITNMFVLCIGTVAHERQDEDGSILYQIVYDEDGDKEEFEYKEVIAFHKLFQADRLGFLDKEVRGEDVNDVGLPCKLNISIG